MIIYCKDLKSRCWSRRITQQNSIVLVCKPQRDHSFLLIVANEGSICMASNRLVTQSVGSTTLVMAMKASLETYISPFFFLRHTLLSCVLAQAAADMKRSRIIETNARMSAVRASSRASLAQLRFNWKMASVADVAKRKMRMRFSRNQCQWHCRQCL
jgi:hypothetical protein